MASEFQVQYLDSQNKLVKTTIKSKSSSDVERSIKDLDGDVLSIVEKKSPSFNIQIGELVKLQEKTNFIQQLKTMLSSGVSLVQGLEIATQQIDNQYFKSAIENVIIDIKQGSDFSDAIKKHPKIFDKISIAMVEAGERGGALDQMLGELEKTLKKDVEINDNIKKATRYPKIVGSIMLLSMYVVITRVIPTFTGILTSSGTELPLITKALLYLGDTLDAFGLYILTFIVSLFFASKYLNTIENGKRFFDRLALKNPIFKKINVAAINLRFTKICGTLLSFGVPLKDSLTVAKNVAENSVYKDAIEKIINDIDSGKPITNSAKETGVFSVYLCSMIGIGEEIGALDKMFISAAEYYEVELNNSTEGLSALIEPIITVVMGIFIAIFVGSVFVPMFKMYESVSM